MSSDMPRLARQVHRDLLAERGPLDPATAAPAAATAVRAVAPLLTDEEVARVVQDVVQRIGGLGPLQRHLDAPEVTEVMLNPGGALWVERAGALVEVGHVDEQTARDLVERIVAPVGRRVDRTTPMADVRLADGSRVNVVLPPLAVDGPCITIRRFPERPLPLSAFCDGGVSRLLRAAVEQRRNLLVSGATGAGKTTLLGALASLAADGERIVTVEDAAELRIDARHVVRLEARPANAEGVGEVRVRDLVRNAMRMRPDRLVVGEVRGAEAFDMVQALSTGHDGSLSTCHANGPLDALRRIEALASMAGADLPPAALRSQLVDALDLVVHVARGSSGRRAVVAVHEVVPHQVEGAAAPAVDGSEPGRTGLRTRALVGVDGVVAAPCRPARSR